MGYRIDLQNGWISPIHNSSNGVHADFHPFDGSPKIHIPYSGQTTLDMFNIGSKPNYGTYDNITNNNLGTLKPDKSF